MQTLKRRLFAPLCLAAALLPAAASADDMYWNLPYARASKYNTLPYMSADVNTSLTSNPNYFKTRLATGWNYYKANYIMSSGLVNQMAGKDVGTTTAVSEGQGYGMLLALLNNDQATFNKIFAAANQYMWNGSHKSYYNWKVVNGGAQGQGAATDADLDICLALIFADKLSKNQSVTTWAPYNSGGVTYNSRAMEMLGSIKNNMVSNNYLLPGDNWGGNAMSNLNPSYFATAYFRVFDQYQTQYSFTAVATSSYSVLKARRAQYNKGQAPDWCTSSGGQASSPTSGQTYQGLGMTNDAMRVPWRICMDALWFDNADAKAFCSNSRNTLTNYTQSGSNPTALLTQMGQYTNNQAVIANTAGSFHLIAVWLCAAMGSRDAAYAKQVINGSLFQRICGQAADCFGDRTMSDHYYYYNQSVAMLCFAAITGQFPNVWADTIKIVKVKESASPIAVLRGLSVSPMGIRFSLPGNLAGREAMLELFDMRGRRVFSHMFAKSDIFPDGSFFASVAGAGLSPNAYVVKVTGSPSAASEAARFEKKIVWK